MTRTLCIELFGGLRVRSGARTITRFRTHKTAALLAFLAYHKNRMHTREVLVEKFWPEAESRSAGRASLSVALGSLRAQLEPPGIPGQSVLRADTNAIGLHPDIDTDVDRFEKLLDTAQNKVTPPDRRVAFVEEALTLFQPTLLPGFYDDWILPQQTHLSDRLQSVLAWLAPYYEAEARPADAVRCARRLLELCQNPADELPERMEQQLTRLGCSASLAVATVASAPVLSLPVSTLSARRQMTAGNRRQAQRSDKTDGRKLATVEHVLSPKNESNEVLVGPTHNKTERNAPFDRPLTPFFGREEEITRLLSRLQPPDDANRDANTDATARLLTLTGPGGIGKTRIALALAEQFQTRWPETPLHFVALSSVQDARLLPAIVAQAVGVTDDIASEQSSTLLSDAAGVTPKISSSLKAALTETRLLVLDNMEQIADAAAPWLEALLRQAPALICLVTSQVRLAILGEEEFDVQPLPVPAVSTSQEKFVGNTAWSDMSPDALLERWPSLALFVNRAQLAQPDFVLTTRNIPFVVPLVARLEGIPLALELAAARAHVCTPAQMLAQITSQRFSFLVNRRQQKRYLSAPLSDSTGAARHASLHAAFSWTVHLLSPEVQRFFAALSVFRGGWTAEAAEAVTGEPLALDYLAELCDASLIRSATTSHDDEEMRFTILETLREFAATLLEQESSLVDALQEAHLNFFLSFAGKNEPHLYGGEAPSYLSRLAADHDNLRAALKATANDDGAIDSLPVISGLRIATALQVFWYVRGHFTEGQYWIDSLIARADREGSGKTADDISLIALALNRAGVLAMTQGDLDTAEVRYERALALRRRLCDLPGIAATLNNCAIVACRRKQFDQARAFYTESLSLWRELGETRHVGTVLANLGGIAIETGDFDVAHSHYVESLQVAQAAGDLLGVATRKRNMGEIYYVQGQYAQAKSLFRDSLRDLLPLEDHRGLAYSLLNMGLVTAAGGETRYALRLMDTSLTAFNALGVPLSPFLEEALSVRYPDFALRSPGSSEAQSESTLTNRDDALSRLMTLVPLAIDRSL